MSTEEKLEKGGVVGSDTTSDHRNDASLGEDLLQLQDLDPALNQKMHLVNNVGSHHLPELCDVAD